MSEVGPQWGILGADSSKTLGSILRWTKSVWRLEMFGRRTCAVFAAMFILGASCLLRAANGVLAEVRFIAHNHAEKTAGVWVDGQYVGYVKELNGDKKMLLLPGKHEIVVRQPWYKDYVEKT